jgi:hypothetical protein
MKTKEEGTAWLRFHGWVQCAPWWVNPGAYPTPMTTQQATTKQGEV